MKDQNGGAYIMVIIVSLAVFAILITVLSVTINSRQISERYSLFYGVYDLGVAANEQTFLQMLEFMKSKYNQEDLFEELNREFVGTRRQWTLTLDFGTLASANNFSGITSVYQRENGFYITTIVNSATIRSVVDFVTNSLDYYTLEMVEFIRIAD